MISFHGKEIIAARTLGDKLRLARDEEQLSIEEVAKRIQVREEYLYAIEGGRYDTVPGIFYMRNFLVKYAVLLGLNPKHVLSLFEKEQRVGRTVMPLPRHPKQSESFQHLHPIVNPKLFKIGIVSLSLLLLVAYLGSELHAVVSPPALVLESPQDNLVTTEHSVYVSGRTEKGVKVFMNGEEVFLDSEGVFQEEVKLQTGINEIVISAEKKRGKESIVKRTIRVQSQQVTTNEYWASSQGEYINN